MKICVNPARVVVTGLGMMTAIGNDLAEAWNFIQRSESGIEWWNDWPVGKVKFENSSINRVQILALEAARRAVEDAALDLNGLDPKVVGVTASTSKGDLDVILSQSQGYTLDKTNLSIASYLKAEGPYLNIVAACATGLNSISWGSRWIQERRAEIVFAGGSDSVLNPFLMAGYQKSGILAKTLKNEDAKKILRPFDRRRSGTVLGEGSGIVVLESLDHAKKRKAKIYAEILASYQGIDSYHHLKMNPEGHAIAKALHQLIEKGGISLREIDYINLHGTGTVWNDLVETRGIKKFFGEQSKNISFSSTKPFTGHLVGASGAVEFILSMLAMKNQFIPPTLNLEEPDLECDLDYTPLQGREKKVRSVICLSYGFGGHVSGVLARKI